MSADLFAYADSYPAGPGFKESETALAAAKSMVGSAPWIRILCFKALKEHGPATADEIAAILKLTVLSVRPRFSELNRDHRIVDTGLRRPNESGRSAKVWQVQ